MEAASSTGFRVTIIGPRQVQNQRRGLHELSGSGVQGVRGVELRIRFKIV